MSGDRLGFILDLLLEVSETRERIKKQVHVSWRGWWDELLGSILSMKRSGFVVFRDVELSQVTLRLCDNERKIFPLLYNGVIHNDNYLYELRTSNFFIRSHLGRVQLICVCICFVNHIIDTMSLDSTRRDCLTLKNFELFQMSPKILNSGLLFPS